MKEAVEKRSAFILGGTKGLGLQIALEGDKQGIIPIVSGRSAKINAKRKLGLPNSSIMFELDLTTFFRDNNQKEGLGALTRNMPPNYFFLVSGIWLYKPLEYCDWESIDLMTKIHFTGPIEVLKRFHPTMGKRPYHLVVIASTSSWKMRTNETVYCALEAAKAHFTRNFAREIFVSNPDSKVTLVNPGGMNTEFFDGTTIDPSGFMDASLVAQIIWREVSQQTKSFDELQIMRGTDGEPVVSHGPKLPELP